MTRLEDRIRSGLHETAQRIPDQMGTRLRDHRSKTGRPAGIWVGVAAVVGVLVLFSPLVFLNGPDPVISPGEATTSSTAAPASTTPTVVPEPDYLDRFPVVVEVEATGDLIGLQRGHAFKSTDGGESWSEILVDGGANLIDVAPDGTVIAIGNSEHEDSTDALGPDSSVRPAPKVHLYDPVADQWTMTELPRPEFPVDDPRPVPMDGSGNCGIGGIQWTMDAISIAIGDQYVIAGEQRITEETICDQSYQIFWTSQDGTTWTVTEPAGVPGYMTGITWFDGIYVAYGSDVPWYRGDQTKTLEIWTSHDLAEWETADIDLSVLPANGYPIMFPDEEASDGLGSTVVSTISDGVLALDIHIGLAAPGPPASIADIDELRQWVEANGRSSYSSEDLQLALDSINVDFPLDEKELQTLTSFFAADEGYGRLILETTDGNTWNSRYENR
jgi:hypothetical protein